jgi:hypothetical protein
MEEKYFWGQGPQTPLLSALGVNSASCQVAAPQAFLAAARRAEVRILAQT